MMRSMVGGGKGVIVDLPTTPLSVDNKARNTPYDVSTRASWLQMLLRAAYTKMSVG